MPCCPCCGSRLWKSRRVNRKTYINTNGSVELLTLNVEEMRCSRCGKTHRILPAGVIPYKRYSAVLVVQAFKKDTCITVEESTLYRWRKWLGEACRKAMNLLGRYLGRQSHPPSGAPLLSFEDISLDPKKVAQVCRIIAGSSCTWSSVSSLPLPDHMACGY